jgi:hypothetical protein
MIKEWLTVKMLICSKLERLIDNLLDLMSSTDLGLAVSVRDSGSVGIRFSHRQT